MTVNIDVYRRLDLIYTSQILLKMKKNRHVERQIPGFGRKKEAKAYATVFFFCLNIRVR